MVRDERNQSCEKKYEEEIDADGESPQRRSAFGIKKVLFLFGEIYFLVKVTTARVASVFICFESLKK